MKNRKMKTKMCLKKTKKQVHQNSTLPYSAEMKLIIKDWFVLG